MPLDVQGSIDVPVIMGNWHTAMRKFQTKFTLQAICSCSEYKATSQPALFFPALEVRGLSSFSINVRFEVRLDMIH